MLILTGKLLFIYDIQISNNQTDVLLLLPYVNIGKFLVLHIPNVSSDKVISIATNGWYNVNEITFFER